MSTSFAPGWDSFDRRTLRFRDPALEFGYRAEVFPTRRRRQRMATLGGAVIFAALALVAPGVSGLPVVPITPVLLALAAANLLAAALVGPSRTVTQLDVVGISIQIGSGFLLMALFAITDLFTRFAVPALMAQSVFAFSVSRHPFRNAAVISVVQTLDYFAFGIALGLAPGIVVDGFILAATVTGACVGTYVAERTDRQLFAQGLIVADLHRRVNELFHRYLAPEVADALIADPTLAELGGEEVEVTVVFADLTGFTSFSERVSPEEAMAMLNGSFAAAVPVVLAEGGTIVQFSGDAMMAIFNAPVRQADHALRAARAALRLQAETSAGWEGPPTPASASGRTPGRPSLATYGECRVAVVHSDRGHNKPRRSTADVRSAGQHRRRSANPRADWRSGGGPATRGARTQGQVRARAGLRTPQPPRTCGRGAVRSGLRTPGHVGETCGDAADPLTSVRV